MIAAPGVGNGRRGAQAVSALVVRAGLVLGPLALGLVLAANAAADELHVDLKGQPLPPNLVPYGPLEDSFLKVEEAGLRITLPKDRGPIAPLGLTMPLTVTGDFEITATLEFLQVDEPSPAVRTYGLGVLMSINQAARIGRLVRARGEQVATWDRWATLDGKRTFLSGASPCPAKLVRLRLKRTATRLQFLWAAEAGGGDFNEIHQCEFGEEDITELRLELNALPANRGAALDARLIALSIRSGAAPAPKTSSRGWLLAAVLLALGLTLAWGVAWYVRQRRRQVRSCSEGHETDPLNRGASGGDPRRG